MCSAEGHIFDITYTFPSIHINTFAILIKYILLRNVVPFIKKYGKNPVTGEKMDAKDLIRLTFHKNQEGESILSIVQSVQDYKVISYTLDNGLFIILYMYAIVTGCQCDQSS